RRRRLRRPRTSLACPRSPRGRFPRTMNGASRRASCFRPKTTRRSSFSAGTASWRPPPRRRARPAAPAR
ncbi:hypothetical protein MNEG_15167, partial [Monoraphidium neglectum]